LFEEYTKDITAERSETSHSWQDVRDAIQTKRPFVIIVFNAKSDYLEAMPSDLKEYDIIKQDAVYVMNGKNVVYPSVFFVLDKAADFRDTAHKLYEKFDIRQIIVGKAGSEYSTLYSQDGTSSDFGNEIVSTLEPKDFASDDHFVLGSTLYRFIEFVD
jgi:hypothetical protein